MAWTTPRTWIANELVSQDELNTDIRDNSNALRTGGIAISSQAANDFIYASSSTQLARLGPAAAGQIPVYNGSTWVMVQQYAVGDIYVTVSATDPATRFGYGTWAAFGAGRVLVGIDASQTEFDTVEETGGAKTHTLTTSEMPAHNHAVTPTMNTTVYSAGSGAGYGVNDSSDGTNASDSTGITTANEGGGVAHNNLQPYINVYMWRRTA